MQSDFTFAYHFSCYDFAVDVVVSAITFDNVALAVDFVAVAAVIDKAMVVFVVVKLLLLLLLLGPLCDTFLALL